ncbi:MAG TPA: hypothetical protein PL117_12135 [Accumulibacter sp.]|uniref:hypothetical protein n=1 Tax=Accumulibacter sp. TaxID=2053492 RepID=UPI000ECC06A7|nr:hypothetical protein [Accumulibacter sp.]HCZ13296.1 hypothetical protein [Accumulibacter sp.]HRD89121.1 hypothetical protein [Accumulibacter sp.]HRF73514.1 hypothetical protein [Accumulibacter sp.]
MARDSYRQRLASQQQTDSGDGQSATGGPGHRVVRAIWAQDDKAVPIVQEFRAKFLRYPRDDWQRRIELADFEVCPLAGDASRAAYLREGLGALSADDFVLIFSDALHQNLPANSSFFGSFTPAELAQADAPVFWLGAAQKLDLDLWSVGETPMKTFPWKILHPDPPGRFRRENPIALDDDIQTAVGQVLHHARATGPNTVASGPEGDKKGSEAGGNAPAEGGFFKQLFGFFHSDRKAGHG